MADSNVNVVLRLRNAREFDAAARRSSRRIGDIGDQSGRASRQADRLGKSSGRGRRGLLLMGRAAKYGAIALGGFAIVAGKKSVEAASSLNEEVNKTKVVFAGSEKGILKWSKNTANSLGLSQQAALEGASSIGAMLVPMGLTRSKAAGMSKEMTTLAADMASFNNEDPSEMLDWIRAGLSGESEPLKRFGTVLSETRVKQHAYNTGIAENGSVLTEQQKILGRHSLLMKDTADQQGDFGKTSKSWANVQRRLSAVVVNFSAKLGKGLIPHLKRGGEAVIRFVQGMNKGKGPGGEFARVVTGIWQGVKPVAIWFGRAVKAVATFVADHPKLVAFGVALFGIKRAAGKLTGGLFRGGGLRGGSGFVSGFTGGMGQFFGAKFGQYMLSNYGGKFRKAGRQMGTVTGNQMGPVVASRTTATMAPAITGSARGGKLRSAFLGAGRLLGPAMAIALAAPLIRDLDQKIQDWGRRKGATSLYQSRGPADNAGDLTPDDPLGLGKLWKGLTGRNGGLVTQGGIKAFGSGGIVPPGEDTLAGLRYGEFVLRKEAVRDIGVGRLRAMNAGQAPAPAGGGGSAPVIHNHFHVDGKEVHHAVVGREAAKQGRR